MNPWSKTSGSDQSGGERCPQLSPDDERVLDELVDAGFDREVMVGMAAADRERAERLFGLMQLLHDYPVEDGDDTLVHATIARIDRHDDERAARFAFDAQREDTATSKRLIRLPDFITVAAVLLIAVGVLLPIMNTLRKHSVDQGCANNLRYVGYGFGAYAADNDGALPVALAGTNRTWDMFHNVVNLGPLVEGGYCSDGHLDCPGVHERYTGASYSYQCQLLGAGLRWGSDARQTVVLGDRNPLIDAYGSRERMPDTTISFNHGGRGQNVLGNDGSTIWLERPVIGRSDNIWLPRGMSELRKGATPSEPGDAFLIH